MGRTSGVLHRCRDLLRRRRVSVYGDTRRGGPQARQADGGHQGAVRATAPVDERDRGGHGGDVWGHPRHDWSHGGGHDGHGGRHGRGHGRRQGQASPRSQASSQDGAAQGHLHRREGRVPQVRARRVTAGATESGTAQANRRVRAGAVDRCPAHPRPHARLQGQGREGPGLQHQADTP
ncbi:MAG: hypothetical protein FJX72_16220 [Armatimonadetes bacterium]|nr:hypothetical protein [Armatimonadota bacterium]